MKRAPVVSRAIMDDAIINVSVQPIVLGNNNNSNYYYNNNNPLIARNCNN